MGSPADSSLGLEGRPGDRERKPLATDTTKLRRLLLVVTGRPAIPDDGESPDSTRQLVAVALSWLLVAMILNVAVVLAMYLQPSQNVAPNSSQRSTQVTPNNGKVK